MKRDKAQGGFTLIEVMVAFAVLAISLVFVLRLFSIGATSTAIARETGHAVAAAEAILASVGHDMVLEAGSQSGNLDDRYAWQLTIDRFDDALDDDLPVRLYRVAVAVTWQSGVRPRQISLQTLKTAAVE